MPVVKKSIKKTKAKTRTKKTLAELRSYELTIVVSPEVKAEKRKDVLAAVKKQVTNLKGSVDKVDEWGLKDLAYPIAKQLSGWYVWFEIKLSAEAPAKLEEWLEREERVLRHLIVKS